MHPLVSVLCMVYNHEPFLRDTFEGFVNQETDFSFEVIVHDDASTDRSAEIIREYCTKYPDIFVPVYQSVNQYSQGVVIIDKYMLPLCRGQYIAFLDGDDYWCDSKKLQLQVDYMREHPECSLCVHDSELINLDGSRTGIMINGSTKDCDYTIHDVIAGDSGGLFSNNTRLYRREAFEGLPSEFIIRGAGDYTRGIFAALHGYVHYIGRSMAYYRVGNSESWTGRTMSNLDINIKHQENVIAGLRRINEFTENQYKYDFAYPIGRRLFFVYRKRYGLLKVLRNPQDLLMIILAFPKILAKKFYKR